MKFRRVDREFYAEGYADPLRQHGRVFYSAAGYTANSANLHSQAAQNAIFGATSPVTGTAIARTGTFYMNPDGTLYKTTRGRHLYVQRRLQRARHRSAVAEDGAQSTALCGRINAPAWPQIPLERYSLFGRGHMDFRTT